MQQKLYAFPLRLPTLARLRSADILIPLVLVLAFGTPLLLAFAGVSIRHDLGNPLVLNEIHVVPADANSKTWVELYNNTDEAIAIDGWKIGTASENVATLSGTVPARGYKVIAVPNAWNPAADAVILRAVDNDKLDYVHWGKAPATNPITNWDKTALGRPPAPGKAIVRNPQGLDSDTPQDWRQATPTPNTQSPVSLNVGMYRLLFDITNYISLIAGFLMWGAFILIGLIAKRFEMLTGQRSFWIAMIIAPIGIVIYNIIQSYAFFTLGLMSWWQQFWAFSALMASAIAVAYVVYRFYGIARRILEV